LKIKKNRIGVHKDTLTVEVAVALLQEGKSHIAYCPALDLSAYGDNPDEAVSSFKLNVEILIEDLLERGTLEKTLLSLGWRLRQKPEAKYEPPKVTSIGLAKRTGAKFEEMLKEKISIPLRTGSVSAIEADRSR